MGKGNLRGAVGVKRTDIYTMNPMDIKVKWADNPRYDYGTEEEWAELKNSIRNEGVKNPVQIYLDKKTNEVYLAQGYRRMKAVLELVNEGLTDLKAIKVQLIEFNEETILQNHYTQNNTGKPLNDIEMGELLLKVKKLSGQSLEEIASRFGMTYQKVNKLINFVTQASSMNKKLVAQKKLSLNSAIAVTKQAHGIREQNEILKNATSEMEKSGKTKIKPEHLMKSGVKTTVHTASINKLENDTNFDLLKRTIAYASTSQDEGVDVEFIERLESIIDLIEQQRPVEEIMGKFIKEMV